jgi:hypothetical protein
MMGHLRQRPYRARARGFARLEELERRDTPSSVTENFDGSTGGLPAGWDQWASAGGPAFAATAVTGTSTAPNALVDSALSSVTARAWSTTALAADVTAAADVWVQDPNAVAHVFARGSSLNGTTPTYYAATITRGSGGPTVNVIKVVNGTPTGLATPVATASYVSGLWLRVTLDVQGIAVRASVQRVSDGYYLNTSGTWQQAQVWAVSATDSSITAGGYVGIAQPSGSSGTRQFDTFAASDSQTSGSATENFDTTAVGNQPAGWSSYTSDTANPTAIFKAATGTAYSGSNGYAVTPVTSTATIRSWLNTTQPADQTVSAMQYLTGLAPGQVIARGNFLNTANPEFYALAMNRDGDITLQRAKRDAGGVTQYTNLGSLDIGYHSGFWVKMTVEAVGDQIQAHIYRPGTNQYLNGSGAWQSAPVYVFSVTDTGLPAGGYAGVGRPSSYAATVTFDDFSVTTAAQPADATVSFDAASFAVTEQEGAAKVTLVLSEPLDYRVDVVYSSEAGAGAGAATAGSDFVIKSDTVTFAPGQTERTVILPVKWDGGPADPGEFFNARIGAITADGTVTVSGPAVVPVNITDSARTGTTAINSTWLNTASHRLNPADANSPYKLGTANTTYVLEEDVNAPNTAFVVTAGGVNLNLNWHTVNYDTVSYPDIPNGGFEAPISSSTDWDLTGAPGAERVAAGTVGLFELWGDWVLRLPNITAAQTIKSKPVNVEGLNLDRDFAATITPLATAGQAKVTLAVFARKLDNSVQQVASYAPAAGQESLDAAKGYSPTAFFTPGATATNWKEVWMEVTVTPLTASATVSLDYAALTTAWNHGIYAARFFSAENGANAPRHLKAAGLTDAQYPTNFTLRNGSVLQTGRSYEGHSLFFRRLRTNAAGTSDPNGNGFTVDAVTTKVGGTDGRNLVAQYATDITITNSTFDSTVDRVRRRTAVNSAISIGDQASGTLEVVNNVVKNVPQAGIDVSRHNSSTAVRNLVTDNQVTTRGIVTNGYGLKIYGLQNFTVARNAVFAENGRGLLVEGDGDFPDTIRIIDGDFTDNYIEVYEEPNFEYPASSLQTPALRVRNYNSPLRDLTFERNTFVAKTDANGAQGADAARITLSNAPTPNYPGGAMTGSNIRFEDNHFKGIVASTGTGFHAHALSLTSVPAGTGLEFWGNTFESNYQALNLGNALDGAGPISGVVFGRNTFKKTTEGGDRPDFRAISVGEHNQAVSNVKIVSSTFAGGLPTAFGSNLFFSGTATKEIRFGFTVDVRVRNGSGGPIAGATVDWLDNGVVKDTWITDSTGDVRVPVVTTTYNSVPANPTQFTTTSGGPFRVRATYNSVTPFEDYPSLTADVIKNFVF